MTADEIIDPVTHFNMIDQETVDNLKKLFNIMKNKYGNPIGTGRHRVAFGNDRVVFKIPKNDNGFHDNAWEFRKYLKRTKDTLPLAKCRLIDIKNIPVLVMELVKPIPPKEKLPSWVDCVDCQQVGRNKNGDIVAYDYA